MKTLALSSGDLVVGQGGHLTISGANRIRQDLSLALGEYYGNDRFHPTWGSTVIDFIGEPITLDLEMDVRSEVARVLATYVAQQDQEVYRTYLAGERSRLATADIIREVNSIEVAVGSAQIAISIRLTTQAEQQVTLNRTVLL